MGIQMSKYSSKTRRTIEGEFILHLRILGKEIKVSDIREMGRYQKTVARLKDAGVETVSELCALDYERLEEIIKNGRRADFIVHLLGLYGLKTAPCRVITTTEVTPSS